MNTIKIGIIGAGRIGRIHAENLLTIPGASIPLVSDLYPEHAEEWARQRGIDRVTDDYREILRRDDIEAVLICSSTDTHARMIEEAAQAGKHLFCEKPVSLDPAQTRKALEAVRRFEVKLQTGFNRRFDPHFREMRRAVTEGKIGDPHLIKITSRDPAPPPPEYVRGSGGLFMDMAIHDFDMARYLSGSEVSEVYVQAAVLADPVLKELGDVDTAVTLLKFANGALGVIDNSRQAVYGYDQRAEVFGSKGCVQVANERGHLAEISSAEGVMTDKPKYFFLERYREAYRIEMMEFLDAVRHDRDVPVSGEDGYRAELIAHAAKRSWLERRPVPVSG